MCLRARVLSVLVATATCFAADSNPASDTLTSLNLEQLMQVQVYTASKHAQEVSETPALVTVITQDEIRTYGYRTLADVLRSAPGFWVNYDRMYSYVGLNGFARPGDENTRVLLLVNGHRMNDEIFGTALIGRELPLDIDLIERIEIVRGAGSSLYGSNAFLGVVNIITRSATLNTNVELSSEGGSNYWRKLRVTAGVPQLLDGSLFSISLYQTDGRGSLYFPEYDSPLTNNGMARWMDGEKSADAYATVSWKHFQLQGLFGTREKTLPTGMYGTIFNDPETHVADNRGFIDLTYKRSFLSGTEVTSRWFYDGGVHQGLYAGFYPVFGPVPQRVLGYDREQADWFGTQFDLSRPLGRHHRITTGFELRYTPRQLMRSGIVNLAPPAQDSVHTSFLGATYIQDEVAITSHLSLNAGVRFDDYSTFGATVNPRTAIIFRPDRKTSLKYTYGRAFRAPTNFEMYYTNVAFQKGNPAIKPERIQSHSIGAERAVTPWFRVNADFFYNSLSELLEQQADPSDGFNRFVNLSSVSSKGFDLELSAERRWLRSSLAYTYQQSTDRLLHTSLINTPAHLAKLKLLLPIRSFSTAGVEMQYISSQTTYRDTPLPSLLVSNLTISNRRPILGFDVSASCYNLLNRTVYNPGAPGLLSDRVLQDGRVIRFQLVRRIPRG